MKSRVFMITALLALVAGTATAASAVEFNVGPGGVYVGPGEYHRYYRDRDYGADCRVVVRRHTNRYGEDVTERRRICD
jgi:hypothetical protein